MHRLAELSDLKPVFAIYMDATVVPFLGYDPMPIEAFQPIFRELVESRCFFVYEVSGELAGFYKASRHPGRCRHRGSGRLRCWDRWSRDRWSRERRRNRGSDRRLGFEIEGKLRKFYKRSHEAGYVDDYILSRLFD